MFHEVQTRGAIRAMCTDSSLKEGHVHNHASNCLAVDYLFRRKAIILITCRRPHSTPVVHIICTRMRAKKKSTRCEKKTMSAMLVCFA